MSPPGGLEAASEIRLQLLRVQLPGGQDGTDRLHLKGEKKREKVKHRSLGNRRGLGAMAGEPPVKDQREVLARTVSAMPSAVWTHKLQPEDLSGINVGASALTSSQSTHMMILGAKH